MCNLHWIVFLHVTLIGSAFRTFRYTPPVPMFDSEVHKALPSTANCTEKWMTQPLDHFSDSDDNQVTFAQRYFVYDKFWDKDGQGPIFFYCGNEADITLYINAIGFMWEKAEVFGAYLVFAEHRDYGNSHLPFESADAKPYLSHELALADYARLLRSLLADLGASDSPVIAFGGSYGGMLAAWMRMQHPSLVAGSISASAPMLAFQGEDPPWDSQSYNQIVTNSAKHYSWACAANVHSASKLLDKFGRGPQERAQLQQHFNLCETPANKARVDMLHYFIRNAFDILAMGNYPWPSVYLAGTAENPMPAWPLGEACSFLADSALQNKPEKLFPALRRAVSVLYNVTGNRPCYDLPDYPTPQTASVRGGTWDWQFCTENLPDSFWFSTDGRLHAGGDMFWPHPYNESLVEEHCRLAWGVTPRTHFIVNKYGGRRLGVGHSNIIFSNGGFDGWSSGGVATNLSDSLVSILIPDGGHHLDLMFSHPEDPPSVRAARELEVRHIQNWIDEYRRGQNAPDYYGGKQASAWGDRVGQQRLRGQLVQMVVH